MRASDTRLNKGWRWLVLSLLCACAAYAPMQPEQRLLLRDLGDLIGRGFTLHSAQGLERAGDGHSLTLWFRQEPGWPRPLIGYYAGCNALQTEVALHDGRLRIDNRFGGTEMACSEEQYEREGDLARFLQAEPTVVLQGNQLTLTSRDGVLVFRQPRTP